MWVIGFDPTQGLLFTRPCLLGSIKLTLVLRLWPNENVGTGGK